MSFFELPASLVPVLVTKADVLDYYAKASRTMASGLSVASRLVQLPPELIPPSQRTFFDEWKAKLPAPDLQIGALNDVAKMLSQLATEERILAARAADYANQEPTRG